MTTDGRRDVDATEARMRSVVDHIIDGVVTIDERGTIATFNRAAERIFGYAAEEMVGRNVKVLMPEPYRSEHDDYLANYLRTGRAKIIGIGREVLGQRRDGEVFPMELAISEFHLDGQRFFTGIVRDITERKRLEDELRRRVEELAQADRQKNEFLAMLAHELRNPLAPLRNALFLLRMPEVDAATLEQAHEMADRQMQQLVRLVDDLLDVSRIVRGRIELRREPVNLAVAVERAVETSRPLIDAHRHQLEVELPAEPLWVEGDLIRLAQAIANLLHNAAKYTDEGGRIRVTAEREDGQALLRVRDSGIGIAAEALPHIFDLFVQGNPSLARSEGGLGIGLTLVRRLVEMHGGEVTAASAGPGHGSEFVLRLPVLAPERSRRAEPAGGSEDPAEPRCRHRVLVVDDHVDAAESIAAILRLSGCETRAVFDPHSALEVAARFRPQVLVIDIGLPGMDGYELARRLRERPELDGAPLVALTGYGQAEDRRRAAAAGFDHHLTKPVDPAVLRELIERLTAPGGGAEDSGSGP